ncbi:Formiminotetrahydrofolate cyclodeaminase [Desulfofundulus australicus DSM 11792]|jgi:formiminotetrahydrofolate cyclodeaminase|uniref:Formiminotetrahydrofolate cyclodeaminase n=1 Tax=Desulfofundulus australicus DSM 11792 TaxID=1121425 RepID=A0A1M5AH20_9FIRM|nr:MULTISPECIES: cyclodeaminase/cyclohydrolase family protein [Desulfofundulus]MDK2887576.1 methenyltetrahydrofolate cyclohydrolase [Thermoanaerobacter sp.]SHF29426.1 Formiminotetrahydrofolate cyclodeaminase [Desulfofundulus australicus DSM 11792]
MSEIFDSSFRKILAVAASDAPTPGGGSVSAMVGALGVAMTAMVGNLTVGKPKFADVEPQVKEITGAAYFIMNKLEKLVAADIAAFGKFMEVYRMPKNTEEEKARRDELMQKALKTATDTPMEVARTLLEALQITERLARIGNKMAISDAGVAAYVCEAAINAVLLSADINIPMIKDGDYVRSILEEKERIVSEARRLKDSAVAVVQERMK